MSTTTSVQAPQRFPFDADFQKCLLRMLCEDSGFAHVVSEHLQPTYFENEVLSWAYGYAQSFRSEYGTFPSVAVLKQQTRQMDPKIRGMYDAVLSQVCQANLKDEKWLRDSVFDFVKRNVFVKAFQRSRTLYNAGNVEKAYDEMMSEMEKIHKTTWEPVDESFFMDELPDRHNRRLNEDPARHSIGTGFPTLDHILSGGLSKGELGIWIAYPKRGKSTMLVNHGVAAVKQYQRVAHFVFEGSRQMVENRYDANFMNELYQNVKFGVLSDSKKYTRAWNEYQSYKGLMVIRGYTERWDYSVLDIHEDLVRWKREKGWEPELVIVDYGDLIGGRDRTYPNEREKQKAAFRDLKSLANRGYALWTASQAQRPSEKDEAAAGTLRSRQIADCYEKVRVADFLGSLNSSISEIASKRMRIHAELYRDNAAEQTIQANADFATMTIREDTNAHTQLGYAANKQIAAQTGFKV